MNLKVGFSGTNGWLANNVIKFLESKSISTSDFDEITRKLDDSRQIPRINPSIVANIIPVTATNNVFNNPTKPALKCVSVGEYSING